MQLKATCLHRIEIQMSRMSELRARPTANNSTDQDHGAILTKDADGAGTAVGDVEVVCQAQDQGGADERRIGVRGKPEAMWMKELVHRAELQMS